MDPADRRPVEIHDPPGFGKLGKIVASAMVTAALLFVVGTILTGLAAAGVLFGGH